MQVSEKRDWLHTPRLDTEQGRARQRFNIERSRELLHAKADSTDMPVVMLGGDNFDFVCWGDVTELKLWQR